MTLPTCIMCKKQFTLECEYDYITIFRYKKDIGVRPEVIMCWECFSYNAPQDIKDHLTVSEDSPYDFTIDSKGYISSRDDFKKTVDELKQALLKQVAIPPELIQSIDMTLKVQPVRTADSIEIDFVVKDEEEK